MPTPPRRLELTQDQMEAALLAGIQITPDDLRALMQARARSVQAALVNTGKVEGERISILLPQTRQPRPPKARPAPTSALDVRS